MVSQPAQAPQQGDLFENEPGLYHQAGDKGFFALLWRDPQRAKQAERYNDERQRLLDLAHHHDHNPNIPAYDLGAAAVYRERAKEVPRLNPVKQHSHRIEDLPWIIEQTDPNRDTWISQAEFAAPNRRVVNLARVGLAFVDLDPYSKKLQDGGADHAADLAAMDPDEGAGFIRAFCLSEGIPAPSVILFSGRGYQVKWLFEKPIPRAALPRWNALQRYLIQGLARLGADPGAKDASRVLRLEKTVNTKSGLVAHVVDVDTINGEVATYKFDHLAEAVLPYSRNGAEADEFTVIQGGRKANAGRSGVNNRALSWRRLEDLRQLAKMRGWTKGQVPEGWRTTYLVWSINFLLLSGAVPHRAMWHEARVLAGEIAPEWGPNLQSKLSSIWERAKYEMAGKQHPNNARAGTTNLYTPGTQRLVEIFQVEPHEQDNLPTMQPRGSEAYKKRDRDRKREKRGSTAEERQEKRSQAILMAQEGHSQRAIAEALKVGQATVYRWLRGE